jgi:hypothetical protein
MLLLWEGGEVLSVNKLNKNVEMASEYDKNNKNKQTNKQTISYANFQFKKYEM